MSELFHIAVRSKNGKTGPMPVTTSPESTCPPACPFKGNGCYGDNYRCRMHWDKVTEGERGVSFAEFCKIIFRLPDLTLWRHDQVGDLRGEHDLIDYPSLAQLIAANRGKRGFTYTHYPVLAEDVVDTELDSAEGIAISNRSSVKDANDCGFAVNLSANDLSHADKLAALGIGPVAVVIPGDQTENCLTPEGRKVVVCPHATRGVQCVDCGLCARIDRRVIIGLPAHGAGKKKIEAVIAA